MITNTTTPSLAQLQSTVSRLQEIESAVETLQQVQRNLQSSDQLGSSRALLNAQQMRDALRCIQECLALNELIVETEDGQTINVLSPGDLLSPRCTNASELMQDLIDSVTAMMHAAQFSPRRISLKEIDLTVHNSEIAHRLQPQYTAAEFTELEQWLYEKGVFSLMVNPENGLVKTCAADENWEMSARQWVTDTCRCGDIQRKTHPATWPNALVMLARFYNQPLERDAIEQSIKDPKWYREGPLENGVAHVFVPHNFTRDPGYNNSKRLESHGLALKAFCDTIIDGLVNSAPWGFTDSFLKGGEHTLITESIALLAGYIRAINTDPKTDEIDFNAPSCGNWEEVPFPGGLTWDIESMRQGLMSLYRLMFGPSPDGDKRSLLELVRREIAYHKHSKWLANERELLRLIEAARLKVIDRIVHRDPPCESPVRETDSSLAFITACNTMLVNDLIENAHQHFRILQALEDLIVRDHGILRYAAFDMEDKHGRTIRVFDNYLADNYWQIPALRAANVGRTSNFTSKRFKSLDCSTEDKFIERGSLAREEYAAEWCWVSVMSEGYSTQVIALDRAMRNREVNPADAKKLMRFGVEKATEHMNRALARITGDCPVKSNGKPCPPFAVPEAYEYVSSLMEPNKLVALPGVHTPLSWGVASLHIACEKLKQAIGTVDGANPC